MFFKKKEQKLKIATHLKQYIEVTQYSAEIQIEMKNKLVLLHDFNEIDYTPEQYIKQAYKDGVIQIRDKSNRYVTFININDIHRILFITKETKIQKEIKNENQN